MQWHRIFVQEADGYMQVSDDHMQAGSAWKLNNHRIALNSQKKD
jgi:hypothetical protein